MVRIMLFLFLTFCASLSCAFAGEPTCKDCDDFKHGVHRQVIPTDDVVCIWFIQPHTGNVLLRIDLPDGKSRSYTKQRAGTTGRFCVGRSWVKKANSMIICNDENHADYIREHVERVAVKSKLSKEGEACLFGAAPCREKGYATR